jgi:hypothetical protein
MIKGGGEEVASKIFSKLPAIERIYMGKQPTVEK